MYVECQAKTNGFSMNTTLKKKEDDDSD